MPKVFFRVALIGALLSSFSLADDFLAKVTNGALSDNSAGVKRLSQEEASQVVGGYYNVETACYATRCYAFADHKTKKGNYSTLTARERVEINNVTFNDPDLYLGFMVQKNWAVSNLGKRFSYLSYAAVVLDGMTGQVYRQSSQVLNHNLVVRQLSIGYKDSFDRYLGKY